MAGRAGRRFLDLCGNVIIMLFGSKTIKTNSNLNPYPKWIEISNITNGKLPNIQSKYISEPNYILKNIETNFYREMSCKSFKYYKSIKSNKIEIPKKYSNLYLIDKKIKEFASNGISYNDKNYSKLLNKFTKAEQTEYKKLLNQVFNNKLSELEIQNNLEDTFRDFLLSNDFIQKISNNYFLTLKGNLAIKFNETNSIIFSNNIDKILSNSSNIIPILSLWIDDGFKSINYIPDRDLQLELDYWTNQMTLYSNYIGFYPKWTFWINNYPVIKYWLELPNNSSYNTIPNELDHISEYFQIDLGTFVKILIKLYQVVGELLDNLNSINRPDLFDKLFQNKEKLIRHPLKIESLYVNLSI